METLTQEEIEMCQTAVSIVIDIRDLTQATQERWDFLCVKLERMQREISPTPPAACEFCGHLSAQQNDGLRNPAITAGC